MSNTTPHIHDAAWEGTLSADMLHLFTLEEKGGSAILNSRGRIEDITPLAAACWQGRLDIVCLLLSEGADPNALSQHDRTPLFYAISKCATPERAAIVRALLGKGANIDKCCGPDDDDYTPLMLAIAEARDVKVIHELVDSGASLDIQNSQGRTARDLASEMKMTRHLRPKSEREAPLAKAVDFLMQVVLSIVAFFGMVKDMFGMSGAKYDVVQKDLEEMAQREKVDPHTPQGFKAGLDAYVQESGLEKFFAPGDDFLQTLAQRASDLRNDPDSTLGTAENIKHLIRYSLYQTIFYCDNSRSMKEENRLHHQKELVVRIAAIATKIVPDNTGVGLEFINPDSPLPGDLNIPAEKIRGIIEDIQLHGGTPIGTHLRKKILDPHIYRVLDRGEPLKRPFLICILTDGEPSKESVGTLKDVILECRRKLREADYEPTTAILFLISQIGDNEKAKEFLDKLGEDSDIRGILHLTTDRLDSRYEAFRENERGLEEWLLKTLSRPIMENNDDK